MLRGTNIPIYDDLSSAVYNSMVAFLFRWDGNYEGTNNHVF
jgi:hypothetical protein